MRKLKSILMKKYNTSHLKRNKQAKQSNNELNDVYHGCIVVISVGVAKSVHVDGSVGVGIGVWI